MGGVIFHKVIFLIGVLVYDVFLKWAKRCMYELIGPSILGPGRVTQIRILTQEYEQIAIEIRAFFCL